MSQTKKTKSIERKNWYAQSLIYLTGREIIDFLGDTLKHAREALKDFYLEHKKVIDTIGIILGAVASIALVVATHGAALVPLLHVLGMSLQVAAAISTGVSVLAVLTSGSAAALNVLDIWYELDSEEFNA